MRRCKLDVILQPSPVWIHECQKHPAADKMSSNIHTAIADFFDINDS
jgi:hypothetical protein